MQISQIHLLYLIIITKLKMLLEIITPEISLWDLPLMEIICKKKMEMPII